MAKPKLVDSPDDELEVDDEEEVFTSFGISDDNAKKRVREMSAARVLAHRKINKKKKEDTPPPDDQGPWGRE